MTDSPLPQLFKLSQPSYERLKRQNLRAEARDQIWWSHSLLESEKTSPRHTRLSPRDQSRLKVSFIAWKHYNPQPMSLIWALLRCLKWYRQVNVTKHWSQSLVLSWHSAESSTTSPDEQLSLVAAIHHHGLLRAHATVLAGQRARNTHFDMKSVTVSSVILNLSL